MAGEPIGVQALLVLVGVFCVIAGAAIVVFADRIQEFGVAYQLPVWQLHLWSVIKRQLDIAGPAVLLQLRLAGLIGFVLGTMMLVLALRPHS